MKTLLRRGSTPARTQTRACVLDLLPRRQHPDVIAETLDLTMATVFNVKRRYLQEGLEAVLFDKPRSGNPPTIGGSQPAKITALACLKTSRLKMYLPSSPAPAKSACASKRQA